MDLGRTSQKEQAVIASTKIGLGQWELISWNQLLLKSEVFTKGILFETKTNVISQAQLVN